MTTKAIRDYLTKQLFIEKNIVSYRSLSRVFFIHVNAAKNELAAFHAQTHGESSTRTYLLSGELKPQQYSYNDDGFQMEADDYGMGDVLDEDDMDIEEDSEEPLQTGIMLVSENDLDDQKEYFEHVYEQTIQCLSPSPLHDGDLLCPLTEEVWQVDSTQKGVDHFRAFGRVIGKGIINKVPERPQPFPLQPPLHIVLKRKREQMARNKAKAEAEAAAAAAAKPEKPAENRAATEQGANKRKPSGKLDFGKAKTKEMKEKEKAEATKAKAAAKDANKQTRPSKKEWNQEAEIAFFRTKSDTAAKSLAASKDSKPGAAPTEQPKRGIKRKSPARVNSDESSADEANPPAKASTSKASGLRLHKGAVLSDEEDAIIPPLNTRLRKGRVPSAASSVPTSEPPSDSDADEAGSEAERQLKAMMDVDDDKVERVTRDPSKKKSEDDDAAASQADEDEDVAMDIDDVAKPKPKRRTYTKAPIGSNGLKKKRVRKTEHIVDEKGYMVTRDIDAYESVDEAEAPPVKKGKAKAASKEDEVKDQPPAPEPVKQAPPPNEIEKDEAPSKKAAATKPSEAKSGNRKILKPGGSSGAKAKKEVKKGQPNLMTFFSTKPKP